MIAPHKGIMVLTGFMLVSCDTPFTPRPSENEALFRLEATYTGESRLIHKIPVTLTWSEVPIEDFSGYKIYRAVMEEGVEIWEQRSEISNPLQVSYVDTIDDDRTFRYRVRIEDAEGNFRAAETDPLVFSTTHLVIPDDMESIQEAYDSPFMDSGDTLWVGPGTYGDDYRFMDKDVVIQSTHGRDETVLERGGTVVTMGQGTMKGFTVRRGRVFLSGSAILDDCVITGVRVAGDPSPVTVTDYAEIRNCLVTGNEITNLMGMGGDGGGMTVQDFATVRNCRIAHNRTTERGGGLSVSGQPTITNTIMDHNYAAKGGGGILVNSPSLPTLINCVVYANRSGLMNGNRGGVFLEKGSVPIRNSILWNNSGDHPWWTWSAATYSDIQGHSGGTGNINLAPRFVDPKGGDFHLSPDSPCVDAGHPGDDYRDVDGSRNDMGAHGGPLGQWP
ncbi:MAG: right-handed parallel beta-helix repeat-containing protein [Fidelibacterota bacterium]